LLVREPKTLSVCKKVVRDRVEGETAAIGPSRGGFHSCFDSIRTGFRDQKGVPCEVDFSVRGL
jgi:hypothetical protein